MSEAARYRSVRTVGVMDDGDVTAGREGSQWSEPPVQRPKGKLLASVCRFLL
jgi:hypothetical protein